MRFSCESCKAQLQIADEKVRGRRLIVRCKRCGAKIGLVDPLFSASPPRVVEAAPAGPASDTESTRAMDDDVLERALQASRAGDGSANGSPQTQRFAAPAAPLPANPAVWFAMLQGKQTGPLTRAELEARADEGEVGPRTYIWCEGMESWQRAQEVLSQDRDAAAAITGALACPVLQVACCRRAAQAREPAARADDVRGRAHHPGCRRRADRL